MNIKTKIKNDMWRFNYILPFVKKYQFDEGGKSSVVKHILKTYMEIKPIHGKGKRTVGLDTKELLSRVDISFDVNSRFVYFIDTKRQLLFQVIFSAILH